MQRKNAFADVVLSKMKKMQMLDITMKNNKKDLLKRFKAGEIMEVEELQSIIEIYLI